MHENVSPPHTDDAKYRALAFGDGLLIFDREDTARWVHSDHAVPLADIR